jgi:hypothetical protein
MATLVPTIGEGLSRGSRRHEQHSRTDPDGESLSPLAPGGERQGELAPRGGTRDGHAHRQLQIRPGSCARSLGASRALMHDLRGAFIFSLRFANMWLRVCLRGPHVLPMCAKVGDVHLSLLTEQYPQLQG